jgi:hypothetical protein
MFHQMMRHFGPSVTAIQGNWTYGDNLAKVNLLTAGGLALKEAARQSFTGKRAADWGFVTVHALPKTQGIPGQYARVHVLFVK